MDWEEYFTPRILGRGYEYYMDGAVESIEVEDDIIRAEVFGTELYDVEITLEDDEIIDMECTCPYACEGNNCKHMAAVLYEYFEDDEDDINEYGNTYALTKEQIQQMVEDAKEEDIREFLTSILVENKKWALRFDSFICSQDNNSTVNEDEEGEYLKYIMHEIDDIYEFHSEREDIVDLYDDYYFLTEMESVMDYEIYDMIEKEKYYTAFKALCYMFEKFDDLSIMEMNDSIDVRNRICEMWIDILSKVNVEIKDKMFDWFTSYVRKAMFNSLDNDDFLNSDNDLNDYTFIGEYIEEIMSEGFSEKQYDQKKLDFMEDMIEASRYSYEIYDLTGTWILRYVQEMRQQNVSRKQIENVCKKNWDIPHARQYYVNMFIEEKEYDQALQIIDELILSEIDYDVVGQYLMKKKEIYKLKGDHEAYMTLLWELLLEYYEGDLILYRELKSQYTQEEWVEKRKIIFEKTPEYLDLFYEEEGL